MGIKGIFPDDLRPGQRYRITLARSNADESARTIEGEFVKIGIGEADQEIEIRTAACRYLHVGAGLIERIDEA